MALSFQPLRLLRCSSDNEWQKNTLGQPCLFLTSWSRWSQFICSRSHDVTSRVYFLPIFGGKSQRSFPSSDSGSTSTSATPDLESLSDAPVNREMTLVKSGSWPTSIRRFAGCRFSTVRNLLVPNPGASDSSLRTFALR